MQTRAFGWTGIQVPKIGQGTWNMEGDDRASVIRALRAGLDLGMTHLDTAELYGSGEVETIVAEAIAGRRHEVFLASKVIPENASRRGVITHCDRSLKRLRTDHLDLYLLHWPGRHPLEDTFAAFEELVSAGKIRRYGVSNFDVHELNQALAITGEEKIACNQVLYHIKERAIEHGVIPWCERHGVAIVAYSTFGSGDFPSPRSAGGRVLAEIAEARGATPRQVALSFLLRRQTLFAIPKASQEEHVRENAGADSIQLTNDDVARIDEAFPPGRPRPLPSI